MIQRITHRVLLSLILIGLQACDERESRINMAMCDPELPPVSTIDAVSDSVLLARKGDTIMYITSRKAGFSDNRFFLHLLQGQGSFINRDFDPDEGTTHKIACPSGSYTVLTKVVEGSADYPLRTGQFQKVEEFVKKRYELRTDRRDASYYQKLSTCGENNPVLEEIAFKTPFRRDLENGIFFEIRRGIHILLGQDYAYVINYPDDPGMKIMFHMIRKDRSFVNRSFSTNNQGIGSCLGMVGDQYRIKRISYPQREEIVALRLGMFSAEGNTWTQVLELSRLYENELLRFNGDLEMGAGHD